MSAACQCGKDGVCLVHDYVFGNATTAVSEPRYGNASSGAGWFLPLPRLSDEDIERIATRVAEKLLEGEIK